MPVRTFLALDLDEPIRRGLAAAGAALDVPGTKIRRVARDNLHVTIRFLGDVAEPELPDVCRAAAEAAVALPPFEFAVVGLSCRPTSGRTVRMVWADVDDPTGRMAELHKAVEEALRPVGFPPERRAFHPHVTVARVKFARDARALRSAVADRAAERFGLQHAAALTVYRSDLRPDGPVYTPLARAAFAAPPGG